MVHRAHNSMSARVQAVGYTQDWEDRVMALLPPEIRHYIKYEMIGDADVKGVAKVYVDPKIGGYDVQATLDYLRSCTRHETRLTWGWSHPQARAR